MCEDKGPLKINKKDQDTPFWIIHWMDFHWAQVKAQAVFSVYLATVDWPPLIIWISSKEHELIIALSYVRLCKYNLLKF